MKKTNIFIFVFMLSVMVGTALFGVFPPGAAFADDSFSYTVSSGDCLWLIANKFGTTVDMLKATNNLDSDMLQIGQTLIIPGNAPYYQQVSRGAVSRPNPPSASVKNNEPGVCELVSWSIVNDQFAKGSTATLQDFETGRQFKIYRLFGSNHADCEPLTAEDSRIMKECFGGQWSWDRRPAILLFDGQAIACSMAGMPHGTSQDIYDNDFDGHFDLHFLNSRTHGSNRVDADHQAAVHQAAGQ